MSFVQKIVAENFVDSKVQDSVEYHDLESGIQAVRNLNGSNHCTVFFEGPGVYLFINGGRDGKYAVNTANLNNKEYYNLIDSQKSAEKEAEIVASGGTSTFVPENRSVSLDMALEAARHFYQTGEPLLSLLWERSRSEE